MSGDKNPEETKSRDVDMNPSENDCKKERVVLLGDPITNCAGPKVIRCDPAGSSALAVVHTIVRLATVIVHAPAKDAEPDTGTSTPVGDAAPVK